MPSVLLGRSLPDVFSIYWQQFGEFQRLSANAANLWPVVPSNYYDTAVIIGLVVSATVGLAYSTALARLKIDWTQQHSRVGVSRLVAAHALGTAQDARSLIS